jgi:cellulase/cellobiase CelA1
MRSKKLETYLQSNYPEFMISFYQSRTFEQFHAFQVLVNSKKQIAIKLLEASVKDSEKSISLNPNRDKGQLDWNSYIKMTLDYMSNNYESFVSIGGEIDLNKAVYDRMKSGWNNFGTTDYLRDYMGVRKNGDVLFID